MSYGTTCLSIASILTAADVGHINKYTLCYPPDDNLSYICYTSLVLIFALLCEQMVTLIKYHLGDSLMKRRWIFAAYF